LFVYTASGTGSAGNIVNCGSGWRKGHGGCGGVGTPKIVGASTGGVHPFIAIANSKRTCYIDAWCKRSNIYYFFDSIVFATGVNYKRNRVSTQTGVIVTWVG